MPDEKTALEILTHNCAIESQYTELRSYSVVRNFVKTFPKQDVREFSGIDQPSKPPFIKDDLESTWDGTLYKFKDAKSKTPKSS